MNLEKVVTILKNNKELMDFLDDIDKVEIMEKEINGAELERLNYEYPNLLNQISTDTSVLAITLVKIVNNNSSYKNLRKIKLYIHEESGTILKILKN